MKKSVKIGRLLFNSGIVLLILVTFVCGVSSAGTTESSEFKKLVFAGGGAGGSWYGIAGSIAELVKDEFPELFVSVLPGGSVSNIEHVTGGEIAQMGLTVTHLYLAAQKGVSPFTFEHKNVFAMALIGTVEQIFFMVREEIPINSIEELKEKKYPLRLATSERKSSPVLAIERVLEQYGITFDDLKSWGGKVIFTSYVDGANLVADGHADAFVASANPSMVELNMRVNMKLLPYNEKVIDKVVEKYGYTKVFIPKGKQDWILEDIYHVGEADVALVNGDVPEEVVYGVTKLMCENPEVFWNWGSHYATFDPKTAWNNVAGPLHPGAERYYREAGYMK